MARVCRTFAVSPSIVSKSWRRFQEISNYIRRAGHGCRRSLRTGVCSFVQGATERLLPEPSNLLQSHWYEGLWPDNEKQTSWRWPEGSTCCAHCPALWSRVGICHSILELAGPPLVLCTLHWWEHVHLEHMWKGLENPWKCYVACNIVQHDLFGGKSVMVCGSINTRIPS